MKILKTLTDVELVIVDLEVTLGDKKQNAPTLCARYEGKIIPLNTCLLYTSPSPRDQRGSRMPSSA